MITSKDEYLQRLHDIQNKENLKELVALPSDEPRFVIDANTRNIFIPDEFTFLAVKNDHAAETIYFEIDRYFDTSDLSSKTCVVQFEARDEKNVIGSGFFPVQKMDIDTVPGKIIFGWEIQNDVTFLAGDVYFSVRFYSTEEIGDRIRFSYNFNTTSVSLPVKDTLNTTDKSVSIKPGEVETLTEKFRKSVEAVSAAKTAATEAIQTAQNAATSAVSAAQTTAVNAVDAKGKEAFANISTGIDPTLSLSGKAADAKVTGDKIDELKEDLGNVISDLNTESDYVYKHTKVLSEYSDVRHRYEVNVPVHEGDNVIYCPDMDDSNLTTYLLDKNKISKYEITVRFENGFATFAGRVGTAYIRVFGSNITENSAGYSDVEIRESIRKTIKNLVKKTNEIIKGNLIEDNSINWLNYYYANGIEGNSEYYYTTSVIEPIWDTNSQRYAFFIPFNNQKTVELYCEDIPDGDYENMFLYKDDAHSTPVKSLTVSFKNGYAKVETDTTYTFLRIKLSSIKLDSICRVLDVRNSIRQEIEDIKKNMASSNCDRYLFVSDIHFGFSGNYDVNDHVEQLLNAIKTENEIKNIKAIFIVGDLISNTSKYDFKKYAYNFIDVLKSWGIKVFTIHGNHDCWNESEYIEHFENSMDFIVNTPNVRFECLNTWGTDYFVGDNDLLTSEMKDVDSSVSRYLLSIRQGLPTIIVSHYPSNKTNFKSLLTDDVVCLFGGHIHAPKVSTFEGKTLYLDGSISSIEGSTEYRTFRILECVDGKIKTYTVAPELKMYGQTSRVVGEITTLYSKACDEYIVN